MTSALAALVFFITAIECLCSSSRDGDSSEISQPTSTVWKSLRPFAETSLRDTAQPRIGLALSGGGARGLAQIGVLRALEESGLKPDVIVGTSVGAIIGGLYACGYSCDELEQTVRRIEWNELFRMSDISPREHLHVDRKKASDRSVLTIRLDGLRPVLPAAVSNGQRLTNLLSNLVLKGVYHSTSFDDLKVAFRAVATDLNSGKMVVLKSGNLAEALRASATIPVMYTPVIAGGYALVDGGLSANIPVEVLLAENCDIIIAVNTTSPPRSPGQMDNPLETLDQVLNLLMERPNLEQLSHAHIVIEPALEGRLATDFSSPDSLIAAGYHAGIASRQSILDRLVRIRTSSRVAGGIGSTPLRTGTNQPTDAFRPIIIRDISMHGAEDHFKIRMIGECSRHVGKILTATRVRSICEDALGAYRKHGYALARVDSLHIDSVSGSIGLHLIEGRVGSVKLEGNSRTNSIVILREVPIEPGRAFRIEDAGKGLNNLAGLNLFHQVNIDVQDEHPEPAIVIKVEERPSQFLHINTLIDDERNAQLGIELRDANLFGTGTEISGLASLGFENRRYAVRYSTNRLFYSNLGFTAQAYYDLRDFNVFHDVDGLPRSRFERGIASIMRHVQYGAAASAGLYTGRFGSLTGTLRIEEQSLGTIAVFSDQGPDLSERHRVVSLAAESTVDTQDRYPYPRKGMLLMLSYTSAQEGLGSSRSFSRISAQYEVCISDNRGNITVIPRARFGYGDRTMPRSEDFRIGGLASFLGMRENEYSGRQLLLGSLEARYKAEFKVLFDTYFSFRYDLGRTWEIPEQIKFSELRHGAGFVVGLDTPIGPADFGVGKSFIFVRGATPFVRWGPTNLYFSIGVGML